ncbi:hypothetical protein Fcan01_06064 [Folsomia candida]|uniref:Uncharacterized protein n=1 Tax=Folsomia candida TaxID=158441 RepID=A0A226ETD3_FOLCA|nr:hypothetical protein Fcan01_06064 [Folsomia candida]
MFHPITLIIFLTFVILAIFSPLTIMAIWRPQKSLLENFEECVIQVTVNLNTLDKDLALLHKLQTHFQSFGSSTHQQPSMVVLTTDVFKLSETLASIRTWKYDDIVRYPYHQRKHSACFAKFYFLDQSFSSEGKSQLKLSWRSIFFTERSLTNMNRIPDFIFICTLLDLHQPAFNTLIDSPWKFLTTADFGPKVIFKFTTPTKIFLLNLDNHDSSKGPANFQPVSISVICMHCTLRSDVISKVQEGAQTWIPLLESSWTKVHRNFLKHLVLTGSKPRLKEDCDLWNIKGRAFSTGSTCVLSEASHHHNFSIASNLGEMISFIGKFKLSLIALTMENVYRHEIQTEHSYKEMRLKLDRFDGIHINSRVDHFTFAIVDTLSSSQVVNISLNALWNTFHWKIWVSVVGCGVIVILTIFSIYFRIFKKFGKLAYLFQSLCFLILASAVEQSAPAFTKLKAVYKRNEEMARNLTACRVMVFYWLLIAFGFSSSYKSVMLAVWIRPTSPIVPGNLDQLLESKLRIFSMHGGILDRLKDDIEGAKKDQGLKMPWQLNETMNRIERVSDTAAFLIDLLNKIKGNNVQDKPKESDDDDDDEIEIAYNSSLYKFVIFDTVVRLHKLSKFSSAHLPQLSVTVSPMIHRDLAQSYHWTCARSFFFPIFQVTAMSLYEFGFYEKWQEYFSRYEDRRDRQLFLMKFNCTTLTTIDGGENIKDDAHCDNANNIVREGFGIAAFQGFLIMYSILMVLCGTVFLLEIISLYKSTIGMFKTCEEHFTSFLSSRTGRLPGGSNLLLSEFMAVTKISVNTKSIKR